MQSTKVHMPCCRPRRYAYPYSSSVSRVLAGEAVSIKGLGQAITNSICEKPMFSFHCQLISPSVINQSIHPSIHPSIHQHKTNKQTNKQSTGPSFFRSLSPALRGVFQPSCSQSPSQKSNMAEETKAKVAQFLKGINR